MPPFTFLTTSLIISAVHFTIAMYDGRNSGDTIESAFNKNTFPEKGGQYIREIRNINQQDSSARFGWQNPIRVAPTLRPLQSFPLQPPQSYPPPPPQRYPPPPPQIYPPLPPQRYPPPLPPLFTTTLRNIYRPTTPSTFPLMPPYRYPTTENYKDPLIPSWSNQNNQYVRPPGKDRPSTQAQTSGNCPDGSKRDNRSRQCVQLGSSCGENMVFYEDPSNRDFGQCDCVQNVNRPLLYHPETRKCYFAFQQAYCRESEWLIVEPLPNGRASCSRNPCRQWTEDQMPNWSWTNNDPQQLDQRGPVALLNEQKCSMLGSSCKQEGDQQLNAIILQIPQNTEISLRFVGNQLACRRNSEISEFDVRTGKTNNNLQLNCESGLLNKWRLDGRCKNQ